MIMLLLFVLRCMCEFWGRMSGKRKRRNLRTLELLVHCRDKIKLKLPSKNVIACIFDEGY